MTEPVGNDTSPVAVSDKPVAVDTAPVPKDPLVVLNPYVAYGSLLAGIVALTVGSLNSSKKVEDVVAPPAVVSEIKTEALPVDKNTMCLKACQSLKPKPTQFGAWGKDACHCWSEVY